MSHTTSAHLGMLVCAVIVGASFPVVEGMSGSVPPLQATAVRFAIAAAAMLAFINGGRRPLPGGRVLLLYGAMGLSLAGFFGAMFWAAARTSALSMAAIYLAVPLLAYLLGREFGVEPRAPWLLRVLLLGAAGAGGLVWARSAGDGEIAVGIGELLFAAGCVAFAFYPVLSRWGLDRGWLPPSAAERTLGSLLAGALLIGSAGLVFESPGALLELSRSDWLIVAYLGVVSSSVTFWLMQHATQALTPGTVTGYSYLTPFVSMVVLALEEPSLIGWHWAPGSLLVVTAMTLLLTRERRRPPTLTTGSPARAHEQRLCAATCEA